MPALTAELDCLELVVGLEPDAVNVAFVAHDLVQRLGIGKKAPADVPLYRFRGNGFVDRNPERTFAIIGSERHIIGDCVQVDLGHFRLVAPEAMQAPEKLGLSLREDRLEVADGFQAIEYTLAMTPPLGLAFDAVDYRAWGAKPMLDRVELGDVLSLIGFGSSSAGHE